MQHRIGFFQRRTGRHIHHDLEFRLVVERQHLQYHQLHHAQPDRQHQAAQYHQPQLATCRLTMFTIQEGSKTLVKETTERSISFVLHFFVVRAGKAQHQPRRDDEGHCQRDQHPHAGVNRDRAHVRPHQSTDKRHRQQSRNHRESSQNGRTTDLIYRLRDDLRQGLMCRRVSAACGCSRPPRWRHPPVCRWKISMQTGTRG